MRALFGVMVLALLVASPSVTATVIVPAEFSEVVNGSELIVYGRVSGVRAAWAEGRRRIDSIVTVEVMSWFKGGPATTLSFTVPGGEIGRYRSVTVGAPIFTPGEEAFLFLKTEGTVVPYVFGLNQGVFRVRLDARGDRQVVTPALVATSAAPEAVTRGAVSRRPMALDAFRTQIRTAMTAGRRLAQ